MMKIVHHTGYFVALVLMQALVLNHMHVGGYATPFFYIYLILKMPTRTSRNRLTLAGFLIGLAVDTLSNTPGMNAAAATCLAFWRTPMLRLVTLRDADEDYRPGIHTIGLSSFMRYTLLASLLFCSLLMLIDTCSFFNPIVLTLKIVASTLTTILCISCAEYIRRKKE